MANDRPLGTLTTAGPNDLVLPRLGRLFAWFESVALVHTPILYSDVLSDAAVQEDCLVPGVAYLVTDVLQVEKRASLWNTL